MKTFPSKSSPDGRLIAFEIENAYIGPTAAARLLEKADGVSAVQRRRPFSAGDDIHVRFEHHGHSCILWEPYGDNSRYWIGPEDAENFSGDIRGIETVFNQYSPPMHRRMLGNILSLRFFKH